ncbi:AfsR/SARP family transcriptional regulator [Actinoplanes couchii]|uniref:AfsR/SARP family transcriptional regulator n=1 Tax=Actinoplanes couchii TaxID=403638 RepID=UPI001EF19341|nr:BTAD domain-containing putative transcriptional regulator [Actinoplanes couchii]MDR6319610.1 DNA-binding SARP family transcriptional activator [Actinoplanes couchii]
MSVDDLRIQLHESVQACLVTVLAAAGQQAEALATFRAVRGLLVEELGIDPGPALREAHRRILSPWSDAVDRVVQGEEREAVQSEGVLRA